MKIDAVELFSTIKPGFFETKHIRSLPPEKVYEEQIIDLHSFTPDDNKFPCPEGVTFGIYNGDFDELIAAVRSVEKGWVSCYHPGDEVYCGFDGDKIVSFCILEVFGEYKGLRICGPGCVGTIPEYRKRGIGLRMIQNVTAIFKERGYDISYIHYTGVGRWYEHLGYETIIKWNCNGIL